MSTHRLIAAMACLLATGAVRAADCRDPAASASEMFVAAPEMRAALALPALECTLAQEVIDRARAQAGAVTNAGAGAMPAGGTAAAGYVPKTKYDNTPWRFDMNQNGRRMTAEEFDAWMKAKGIRVATGKPATVAAPASAPATTPAGDGNAHASGATNP